jgi:hypothetical protein
MLHIYSNRRETLIKFWYRTGINSLTGLKTNVNTQTL